MELLIPLIAFLVWCTTTCQTAPIPMESFHPILGHLGQLPALGLNRSPTVGRQSTTSGSSSIHNEKYGSFDHHALPVDSHQQQVAPPKNVAAVNPVTHPSTAGQGPSPTSQSSQYSHVIKGNAKISGQDSIEKPSSKRKRSSASAATSQVSLDKADEEKGEEPKKSNMERTNKLRRTDRGKRLNPDWETFAWHEKARLKHLLRKKFTMGSTRKATAGERVSRVVNKHWRDRLLHEDPEVVAKALEEIQPHPDSNMGRKYIVTHS